MHMHGGAINRQTRSSSWTRRTNNHDLIKWLTWDVPAVHCMSSATGADCIVQGATGALRADATFSEKNLCNTDRKVFLENTKIRIISPNEVTEKKFWKFWLEFWYFFFYQNSNLYAAGNYQNGSACFGCSHREGISWGEIVWKSHWMHRKLSKSTQKLNDCVYQNSKMAVEWAGHNWGKIVNV